MKIKLKNITNVLNARKVNIRSHFRIWRIILYTNAQIVKVIWIVWEEIRYKYQKGIGEKAICLMKYICVLIYTIVLLVIYTSIL